jgi:hypothetical protein
MKLSAIFFSILSLASTLAASTANASDSSLITKRSPTPARPFSSRKRTSGHGRVTPAKSFITLERGRELLAPDMAGICVPKGFKPESLSSPLPDVYDLDEDIWLVSEGLKRSRRGRRGNLRRRAHINDVDHAAHSVFITATGVAISVSYGFVRKHLHLNGARDRIFGALKIFGEQIKKVKKSTFINSRLSGACSGAITLVKQGSAKLKLDSVTGKYFKSYEYHSETPVAMEIFNRNAPSQQIVEQLVVSLRELDNGDLVAYHFGKH